jgi:hypothetical protein
LHRRSSQNGRPKKKRRMHRAVAFALLIFVCLLSRGAPAFAGTPERAATSNAGEEGETASA